MTKLLVCTPSAHMQRKNYVLLSVYWWQSANVKQEEKKYRNNLSIELGTDQQAWIACCLKVLKELANEYMISLTGFF